MTKAEIISKISERTGIEKTTTSAVVESLMLEIKESIKQNESVFLRGFGTLAKYFKSYPKLLPYPMKYDDVVNDLNEFLIQNEVKNKILFYIPKYTRFAYKDIKHPQIKQLNDLKN